MRTAHSKELQSRSELEVLLRTCVDEVRREVAAARVADAPKGLAYSAKSSLLRSGREEDKWRKASRPYSARYELRSCPTQQLTLPVVFTFARLSNAVPKRKAAKSTFPNSAGMSVSACSSCYYRRHGSAE